MDGDRQRERLDRAYQDVVTYVLLGRTAVSMLLHWTRMSADIERMQIYLGH
jgi:hypothetical protein